MGPDRLRGLVQRGSGPAIRHHHQRLAHLPGGRPNQRLEPLLGVYVPRQYGLQPGIDESHAIPRHRYGRFPGGRLPARRPALDDRTRNFRSDGPVPEPGHRSQVLPVPHPRPRLCESGHPSHGARNSLRLAPGRGLVRSPLRDHDGLFIRGERRDRIGDGGLPAL